MAGVGGAEQFQRRTGQGGRTDHDRARSSAGSVHPIREYFDRLHANPDIPELRGLTTGAINGFSGELFLHDMPGPVATGFDSTGRAVIALAICQFLEPSNKYESSPAKTTPGVVALHERYSPGTDSPDVWVATIAEGRIHTPIEMEGANGPDAAEFLKALIEGERSPDGRRAQRFVPFPDEPSRYATWTLMDELPAVRRRFAGGTEPLGRDWE